MAAETPSDIFQPNAGLDLNIPIAIFDFCFPD
ncbi:uncharacterized protein RAG0_05255 [Rhynchosporium agropyri]|uniref:Uncharacterized protein n=1 Tax=Rhynchosporium agropyri TaxID=914238 RepID=A0A1E1KC76_9HELO|nr:uncharacterized protein RAG0_05255 [Rhynchosporium agropyri]